MDIENLDFGFSENSKWKFGSGMIIENFWKIQRVLYPKQWENTQEQSRRTKFLEKFVNIHNNETESLNDRKIIEKC